MIRPSLTRRRIIVAKWDLIYGGETVMWGLTDAARKSLEAEISAILIEDGAVWLDAGKPKGRGLDRILISKGVNLLFRSEDAEPYKDAVADIDSEWEQLSNPPSE
jgi:hypothetical protein